jgi:hypothetical protein
MSTKRECIVFCHFTSQALLEIIENVKVIFPRNICNLLLVKDNEVYLFVYVKEISVVTNCVIKCNRC